jgi:hypothetical protein
MTDQRMAALPRKVRMIRTWVLGLVALGSMAVAAGVAADNLPEVADAEPKHQAVDVWLRVETIPDGLSLPCARVNIINTQRRGGDKDTKTILLFKNVLILGVDTAIPTNSEIPVRYSLVTFWLTPQDVLRLDLAKQLGTVTMAPRKNAASTSP